MTDDRELLALAAKACSLDMADKDIRRRWNPLHNDGDAFRLACELRMSIDHSHPTEHAAWVSAYVSGHMSEVAYVQPNTPILAVVRRTVVVLAAEIGRGMK